MELLAEKIGMSRTVGVPSFAVTLLKVKDLKVVNINENGTALVAYSAGKRINKSIEGQQKKYNLSKEFNRFITLKVANSEAGDLELSALEAGKKVQITGKTKGRGFSGVMKRHNFAGGPGGHGSRFHRAPGSIGNCEWPGRVIKGRKMPGQYGNTNNAGKNEIISFDPESNILVVKGGVSGANGNLVRVGVL
jgi:large subunit ribosomal protein L3